MKNRFRIAIFSAVLAFSPACKSESGSARTARPPAQAVTLNPNEAPSMGVNLEGLSDYSVSKIFIDVVKTARGYGNKDRPWEGQVEVGKDGWPTDDFGIILFTKQKNVGGTYLFSFKGRANVVPVATDGEVRNLKFNSDSGISTGEIFLRDKADQMMLGFRDSLGGIKDLKILRPGHPLSGREVFYPPFLGLLKPFSVIRFMDPFRINGSRVGSWLQRSLETDPFQNTDRGLAYEYAIQLCNAAKKDFWLNIPLLADDSYVAELAKLVKAKLDPERKIYLEYSNEIWNSDFAAHEQNIKLAETELASEGDSNRERLGFKRVGKRIVEISKIFANVFGPDPQFSRIRPVLAGQVARPETVQIGLEWLADKVGEPRNLIYAVAGAPYLTTDSISGLKRELTATDVVTSLSSSLDSNARKYFKQQEDWNGQTGQPGFATLARYYGLRYLAYEGGPDTHGDQGVDAKIEANRSAMMGAVVQRYLSEWVGCGGDLFMYYNLSGPQGRWGSWGLVEAIEDPPSEKYQAVSKVAATLRRDLHSELCK
jgi:hypothetical protein